MPGHGQTADTVQPRASRIVYVAILDDYPAFRPQEERPHTAPAPTVIVLPEVPTEPGATSIVINPRHATPATLNLALMQVEAFRRAGGPSQQFYVFLPGWTPDIPPGAHGELQRLLASLRRAEATTVPGVGTGRILRLDDVPAYLRDAAIPTRGSRARTQ